jgi:hypothetical protein
VGVPVVRNEGVARGRIIARAHGSLHPFEAESIEVETVEEGADAFRYVGAYPLDAVRVEVVACTVRVGAERG